MKLIRRFLSLSFGTLAVVLLLVPSASATEGAMGRPISGAGIMPYAGVVPPEPGSYFLAAGETWYSGDIGGGRTTPIGASLALDLEADVSFTPLTLLRVWKSSDPAWNYASSLTVPIAYVRSTANVTVGPRTGRVQQDNFGLFDLTFVPFVIGHHLSQTEHASFGLTVWAPTGKYDPSDMASLGLNNWTFIPSASYTNIDAANNVEYSATWGVQFYTENPDTDYRNGVLSDFEFTIIKRGATGLGFGLVGSWIEQLSDDSGPTADLLDGFRGRAFGAGLIVTGTKKIGAHELNLDFRWVHEFENRNRVEGDLFMLNLSVKL